MRGLRATSRERTSLGVAHGNFLGLPMQKVSAVGATTAVAGAGGWLGRADLSTNSMKLGTTSWCPTELSGCVGHPVCSSWALLAVAGLTIGRCCTL